MGSYYNPYSWAEKSSTNASLLGAIMISLVQEAMEPTRPWNSEWLHGLGFSVLGKYRHAVWGDLSLLKSAPDAGPRLKMELQCVERGGDIIPVYVVNGVCTKVPLDWEPIYALFACNKGGVFDLYLDKVSPNIMLDAESAIEGKNGDRRLPEIGGKIGPSILILDDFTEIPSSADWEALLMEARRAK